jgi:hypothetical protein
MEERFLPERRKSEMNKIELAVAPLKIKAMNEAEVVARNIIAGWVVKLEEAGYDRNAAAPFPRTTVDWASYQIAKAKYHQLRAITKSLTLSQRPGSPDPCVLSEELCERFVETFREQAASNFDAYVAKLNKKIGVVTEASLRGTSVWSLSFLDVTKEDGTKETWKTQTIINCSVYGKLFNQWPTRKVAA